MVPTPDAIPFLDLAALRDQTTLPIRSRLPATGRAQTAIARRHADRAHGLHTVNKWVAGIAETFALGLLAETIGGDMPVTAVPWAKRAPSLGTPFWGAASSCLPHARTSVITGHTSAPLHPELRVSEFPWQAALVSRPTRGTSTAAPGRAHHRS
jgi:hypothetical protein